MHAPSVSKYTSFFTARQSQNRIRDSPEKCWSDLQVTPAMGLALRIMGHGGHRGTDCAREEKPNGKHGPYNRGNSSCPTTLGSVLPQFGVDRDAGR